MFSLRKYKLFILFFIVFFVNSLSVLSEEAAVPIIRYSDRVHAEMGRYGMVATQEALATQVGVDVLSQGGNAIDAAVAVGYALSVTLPRAGNLGGGGFMMIYIASENKVVALDYRERAPKASSKDMFLTNAGLVDRKKARFSLMASGVPGTISGFSKALERYGTRSLSDLIQPAIHLAEKGIVIRQDLSVSLRQASEHLKKSKDANAIFYPDDKPFYEMGDRLYQPQLGQTLRLIAKDGADAFYKGVIGGQLVQFMKENDGLITRQDLLDYRSVWREPIKGSYQGYDVYAMPPPSSGGVHLVQLLNLVEPYDLSKMGHNSAQSLHLFSQAMKLAYADRSKYLGDPDYVTVPVQNLISKEYADQLRSKIKLSEDVSSEHVLPGTFDTYESPETTHFSIADRWGNMVSNTYTLNFSYGSGWMIPGTGILLNNEMDDFSAKPGAPNAYGLLGGEKNAIEPGKRMLSSMTPTIVLKDGQPYLATGTPGGSRIITTVFQQLTNIMDFDLNLAEAVMAPRMHHQWWPDELRLESGLSPDTIQKLKDKGHEVVLKDAMGSVHSVMIKDKMYYGFSDLRRPGALSLGVWE